MHTSFSKGTTIWIKFKTNETTVGKFSDHKSGKILLEDGRIILIRDISAVSIRKLK